MEEARQGEIWKEKREVAEMAISHPKFGHGTGALEAAAAFKGEIVGRIGEFVLLLSVLVAMWNLACDNF